MEIFKKFNGFESFKKFPGIWTKNSTFYTLTGTVTQSGMYIQLNTLDSNHPAVNAGISINNGTQQAFNSF